MHVYVLLSALLICIPVKAFDGAWTKVFKKPRKGFNTKTQVNSSNPKLGPQTLSARNLAVHTSLLDGKIQRKPEHLIKEPIKPKVARPVRKKEERVLFSSNGDRIRTTLPVKKDEIVITKKQSKQRKKRR